jgi:membrane associated rhomboid family serine protease
MFLPLGDEPNPRGVPIVTYGLIAVNVAVYLFIALPLSAVAPDLNDPALAHYVAILAEQFSGQLSESELLRQVSAYDLMVFSHGFRPAQPDLVALLTSMFLHAGLMHLAGNMLFLWIYGDNVEHRLGPLRFLLAYLLTGVAATLFHMTFDARSELPLVGASGAISGVLGFYFIWFPHNRVRLWIALFPFFMRVVHWPARMVLGIYLFWDNVMPFLITHGIGGGGVAYGAHIGGFLGGLGWAWWADRRKVDSDFVGDQHTKDHTVSSSTDEVAGLLEQGRFWDAAPAYFRLTADQSRHLLTPHHSIALADWLAKHGQSKAALAVYQRHVRDYPVGPLAAEAHLGAGLMQLNALGQPTAAYQHLVEVFDLNPEPDTANCARQALAEIAAQQKFKVRETPIL